MTKAPGISHRKGISLMELANRFPTEDAGRECFESIMWPNGDMTCPKCGTVEGAYRVRSGKPQPYRCRHCRSYFSLKTNTALAGSNLTLRQWAFGICLVVTNHKSVSSMRLYQDLGVTQKTAWFMLHRIRETCGGGTPASFDGPVEVDEAYFGGRRATMSNAKRKELEGTGLGTVGKTTVVAAKDRETRKAAAYVTMERDSMAALASSDTRWWVDASQPRWAAPKYDGMVRCE